MQIYLSLSLVLTAELVKAESPPLRLWNSGNERPLHGPVSAFSASLPCPSEGYFRHPTDCSQFYRCVDVFGSKRALSLFQGVCDNGLVFDSKISSCNWPELSPPCSDYEKPHQEINPQDDPPRTQITVTHEFTRPSDDQNAVFQQKVSTEASNRQPAFTTERSTEASNRQPAFTTERSTEQQIQQEVGQQQQVHREQQQQIHQEQQQQVHREQQQQVHREQQQQIHQEQQQFELQQERQQVGQNVQKEQQMQQQQFEHHFQREQHFQQQHVQQEQQFQQQHVPSQQQHVQQEQQFQQIVQTNKEWLPIDQETVESEWWIPEDDDETRWTTSAVQQDVDAAASDGDLLCREEGFFRHPGNCSKFYRCVRNGEAFDIFVFECPQLLVFNQSAVACQRSQNYACITHEAAYRSLRAKRAVPETTPQVERLPCPKEGFFRHPRHCQVFYRCVSSELRTRRFSIHTFVCPKNLVFDEEKGTCNWPEKSAPCSNDVTTSMHTTQRPTKVPTSRQKFEEKNTIRKDQVKRRPNTARPDNQTRQKLEVSQSGSTRTRTQPQTTASAQGNCRAPGFFVNRNDCNKYYKCVDRQGKGQYFVRYDFSCPQYLAFDVNTVSCKPARLVANCKKPSLPVRLGDDPQPEITSTTRDPQEISTTRDPQEIPTTQEGVSKSSSNSSQGGNKECTKEGYFRDKQDCNKFYRCVDFRGNGEQFVRYDFSCPEGLVFDEENSVCNWPSLSPACDSEENNGEESDSRDSSASGERTTTDSGSSSTSTTTEDSESRHSTESAATTQSTQEAAQTDTNTNEGEEASSTSGRDSSSTSPETSSEGESTDITCTEEGYFRHPEDCNKFYRCVDFRGDGQQFVRYDFTCPEGLVFDEVNSVCNWPSSDTPCERGSSGRPATSESTPRDQSTSEISSSSATRDIGTDSPASVTDSITTQAVTDSTEATLETSTTSTNTRGTSEEPENTSDQTDSVEQESSSQTSSTGKGSNTECTEAGYFRDPDDCNKFYRCVDFRGDGQQFVRYDFSCPEGLEFDEVNSVCNWPSANSPCSGDSSDRGGTQSSVSPSSTEEAGLTSSPDEGRTELTTEGESGLSSEKDESSTQGSQTESSTSQSTTAPTDGSTTAPTDGSTTAPTDGSTTAPADGSTTAPTDGSTTAPTDGSTTAPTDGSRTTETEENSRTTSSSPEPETESSGDGRGPGSDIRCTEEGYFRNPDDCSKFYRCVDFRGDGRQFVRYDFDCPEGLVFDEVNSVCNWPTMSSPCDTETRRPGQTTSVSPETTNESGRETSASPVVTDSSSTVLQTTETQFETSTDSQTTDGEGVTESSVSVTQTTSGSQTTDTITNTPSETTSGERGVECRKAGFFRDPEDCRKFHRCVDVNGDGQEFIRYDFECPEGLFFDETDGRCKWPEQSPPCVSSNGSEHTTEGSRGSLTESTSRTEATESTSVSTDSGEEVTSQGSSTSSEECIEEGYFRHPSDCRRYYRCIQKDDGTFEKQEFSCLEDEVFDPEKRFCDKRELNPSCQDTTSENTQSTESMTETTPAEISSTKVTSESTSSEEFSTQEGERTTSGTSSTPKSSGAGECTEAGFFRNPDDCNKFYRCVDFNGDGRSFVRYDFECPEGLVFDEVNSVCNWPTVTPACESAKPGRGTTSSQGETTTSASATQTDVASTDPTTSRETTTDTGTDSQGSTGTDSQGSTETDSQGSTGTDSERSTGTDSERSTGTTDASQGQTDSSAPTSAPSGSSTSSESGNKDIQCTEAGFFRHPDDCGKFYRCVDFSGSGEQFVRYDFDCPEGLVFDESVSVCNWPQDSPPCETGRDTTAESTGSSENEETSSESITSATESGTTSQTSSGEQTSQTSSGEQTSQSTVQATESTRESESTTGQQTKEPSTSGCTEEGFFRDPEDCAKYFRCVRNNETMEFEKRDFVCPEGTIFDENGRYCNAIELSPPCNASGSFVCTEEGFFRDPEDCTRYIQCIKSNHSDNFEERRFKCPDDHVFDEEGRYCNAKELSPPCDDGDENGKSTTSGDQNGQATTSGNGQATTSGNGQVTTAGEVTDESQTSGTSTQPSSSFECTEEGFFRDPEDCSKYYQCSRTNDSSGTFEKRKFNCPENHIFDEEGRYCNSIDLAPPCDESSSGNTAEGTSTTQLQTTDSSTEREEGSSESPTNTEENLTESSTRTTTSSSRSSQGPAQRNPECTEAGFFRNPNDCSKFYRCVDFSGSGESFVRYDFDCPEGLVFDEINLVCTWPTLSPPCQQNSQDPTILILRGTVE